MGESFAQAEATQGSFSSSYRFNAKELDQETGNYYYGARYYHPKWSVWLGVDPKDYAFPNVSPYTFNMNNPIMMIDPGGDSTFVTGDGADSYVLQLQSRTKMTVSRDQVTGKITYEGKPRNKFDRALVEASNSNKYDLRIEATTTKGGYFFGGAFKGASINPKTERLDINQIVNTNVTAAIDMVTKNKGLGVGHETIEAYLIGEHMIQNNISSTNATTNANPNPIFDQAHNGTKEYNVDQEGYFIVGLPTTLGGRNWHSVMARGKLHQVHSISGEIK